ncbi:hypothetical protein NQ315_009074 [Exocentrus adspersus]|uniref:Uncharacterized protein n=1 Tax=Exocentrus adspersus TaxID=1586481 RepID=A0AAV8V966_9CUCU|nr:hypothetical protein NQ315_009074 [Exocentrus adspersus]
MSLLNYGETWFALTDSNIKNGFKHTGIYDTSSENATKVNRFAINQDIFRAEGLKSLEPVDASSSLEVVPSQRPEA